MPGRREQRELLESTWIVGMVAPPGHGELTAQEIAWNECRGPSGTRIFSALPLLSRPVRLARARALVASSSTESIASSPPVTTARRQE